MILILHKWQIVTSLFTELLGESEVTVCVSFPAALREAISGKYELILIDAEGFFGAISALSNHGKVVGILASDTNGKKYVEAGAAECIWIGSSFQEIVAKLEKARKGDPVSWQPLHHTQVAEIGGARFGQTQLNVLAKVVEGKTAPEIAFLLGKQPSYVRQVMRTLYKKTGVCGKAALAVWGQKQGVMG